MSQSQTHSQKQNKVVSPCQYRIRVKDVLSEDVRNWLDLPTQIDLEQGLTYLYICPPDQAALYGAILRLRDLGLTLISVETIPTDERKMI